jgi:diguanylate cyclase (GGDEF)-like protein
VIRPAMRSCSPRSGGIMPEKSFFEANCGLVFNYIDQISNICAVLIDEQLIIMDCNRAFQTTAGASSKPVGKRFDAFLIAEDRDLRIAPPEKGFQELRFTMIGEMHSQNNMIGYVSRAEGGYLLFCELAWITEDEIFEEISKINNQLANMTRELNKKNIALEKANATINKLLRSDALTDIANRLYFKEYYQKVQAYAVRHHSPLSLVMADLDHFKAVNDQYGHQAGDQVLVEFAKLLKANCREEDLPVRYGGEEFCILLVAADADQAYSQAERMRSQLENSTIGEQQLKITASFVLATLRQGESLDGILKRADDALYRAKNSGRNRVIAS